jgi:multiple sugar transport system substrate-binding protein
MAHSHDSAADIKSILAPFEAKNRLTINVSVLSWETGWTELVKYALYGHGPDVSEIGSTWVSNLAATNALRPFTSRDSAAIGGQSAFLQPSWRSCFLSGESEMWAVPWLSNVRFIYYRQDLLKQAGIDEATAFQTHAQFEQTLSQLQSAGVSIPWIAPTRNTVNTLHTAAIWVWGAGGQFIDPKGSHTAFNLPAARLGFKNYFGLHRFMPSAARSLDNDQADQLFMQGQAAITVSDPGLLYTLQRDNASDEVKANVRTALPPGVPFVGGSNLVMWRYTRQEKLAMELIRFLTTQAVQSTYSQQARSLPVRLDALENPPFSSDPLYQPMVEGSQIGQAYIAGRMWGLIEDKLINELNLMWAELFANPELDLDKLIADHLGPLGERLNVTLSR